MGGQGLAHNVTSTNETGNGYRSDVVDLETTSDTGGGPTWAGRRRAADTSTVGFRVVAPSAVTGGLHLANASGTNLSGAVNIPA